jgi:arylsulfatase A-like enzyme
MTRHLPACLLLAALALGAAAAERPNILFLFADDIGRFGSLYRTLDGPGTLNDAIATPHLDRLAREGVAFRNAFVNAPSCTPCRSSLLSGQHFWRTGRGAILRGAVWDQSIPTYPLLLGDAGYHLGKMFKVWSPGTPADAPYGGQRFAYEQAGRRFNGFSKSVTAAVAKGRPLAAAKEELYAEVRANFDAFLAARPAGAPFCFWFGPTNAHRFWQRGSGKALWNIDPERLKGLVPPFLPDVPEVREDLADHLGEIQAFDAAIGVILERLAAAGELERTLVVVSGDHGMPGVTHGKCTLYDFGTRVSLVARGPGIPAGRVVDDLVSLIDLAPTFLAAAGSAIPPTMTGRSLLPILRSPAGGQVDPARTWVTFGRERHVDSARSDWSPYPSRGIRTATHLYLVNFHPERWPLGEPYRLDGPDPLDPATLAEDYLKTLPDMDGGPTKVWLVANRGGDEGRRWFDLAFAKRPAEELYDLAGDPHQLTNLADDARFAALKGELRSRLMDELTRTGDPRLRDGGAYFETPPLAGPPPAAPGPAVPGKESR